MSRRTRSAHVVLACIGSLALLRAATARADGESVAGAGDRPRGQAPIPLLRADARLARKLDAARDYVKSGSWVQVAHALQAILDGAEDGLVPVRRIGKDGREVIAWTGVRAEAARLLAGLPPSGREFYHTTYGPRARALLAEAWRKGDASLLAEVARRYPSTAAGVEAAARLGSHHLDRARHVLAAACFQRLLERPGTDELPPIVLFHAALTFRRAGDAGRFAQAWQRLTEAAPAGLKLGGSVLSLADLKAELDRNPAPARPRQALSARDKPSRLEVSWAETTAQEASSRTLLQTAIEQQASRGRPLLPASYPLAVGERIVYRSHRGIHALDLRTREEDWHRPFTWGMDQLLVETNHAPHVEAWAGSYLDVSPHVLFGNAVVGTLSTDGTRVYAVDDLAIPPYRNPTFPRGRWRQEQAWPDFGPGLTDAAYHSRLFALDLASGNPSWKVGGRAGAPDAGVLGDTYFLGPPLPLDGRLYVLAEKNNEVDLLCLRATDGALLGRQALAYAPTRLLVDPGRRIQALLPAYGEGILVCPTNAGVLVGVDILSKNLTWAYPYPTRPLTQSEQLGDRRGRVAPPRVAAEWQTGFTAVEQGRIVCAAPESPSLFCLDLRDGSRLWEVRRADDDLYVAGLLAGRVLIVGKQTCRALDLADGKQLWALETGLPCGRGVADGDVYYLPLKEPAHEKGSAIWAIDVRRGAVLARTPVPDKEVPGNLLLWQGGVFSQTATSVTAYSLRKGP
jgi:outer membrane protein assembly factor BamB